MNRICVFCGSRGGARSAYAAHAHALGAILASRDIELVYGGSQRGIMGALARSVLREGGRVTGVLPHALAGREPAEHNLTELVMVDTMHERKSVMAERADAFIALPGGLGTFEELFETLTWLLLGIHDKPIGVLDVEGFYTPLLAFLDRSSSEGFITPAHRQLLLADTTPAGLLDQLASWQTPTRRVWLQPHQS